MAILVIIGALIALGFIRKSRRKRSAYMARSAIARCVPMRTIQAQAVRSVAQAESQRKRSEAERRRIERRRLEVSQAEADMIHYRQVLSDLLKAYDSANCNGDSEKAIRKRIAYDSSIRRVEKQLETAAYKARQIP